MTTAEMLSMKLLMICLVSSLSLVLAKLMQEQYRAIHAHHFILIIRAHIEKIMPRTFMQSGVRSSVPLGPFAAAAAPEAPPWAARRIGLANLEEKRGGEGWLNLESCQLKCQEPLNKNACYSGIKSLPFSTRGGCHSRCREFIRQWIYYQVLKFFYNFKNTLLHRSSGQNHDTESLMAT